MKRNKLAEINFLLAMRGVDSFSSESLIRERDTKRMPDDLCSSLALNSDRLTRLSFQYFLEVFTLADSFAGSMSSRLTVNKEGC